MRCFETGIRARTTYSLDANVSGIFWSLQIGSEVETERPLKLYGLKYIKDSV